MWLDKKLFFRFTDFPITSYQVFCIYFIFEYRYWFVSAIITTNSHFFFFSDSSYCVRDEFIFNFIQLFYSLSFLLNVNILTCCTSFFDENSIYQLLWTNVHCVIRRSHTLAYNGRKKLLALINLQLLSYFENLHWKIKSKLKNENNRKSMKNSKVTNVTFVAIILELQMFKNESFECTISINHIYIRLYFEFLSPISMNQYREPKINPLFFKDKLFLMFLMKIHKSLQFWILLI